MKRKILVSVTINAKTAEEAKAWAGRKEMSLSEYVGDALKWQIRHDEETAEKKIRQYPSVIQDYPTACKMFQLAYAFMQDHNKIQTAYEIHLAMKKHNSDLLEEAAEGIGK